MDSIVFVSHSSKDRKIAQTLCTALEHRGVKCWVSSRDVEPGANYQESIVSAIRRARAMLLVFSGNANNSAEIMKELALASEYGIPVVPVRAEDVAPTGAFKYELATRQWIDLFDDWETAIGRVAAHVARITGETAAPPVPAAGKRNGGKLVVASTVAVVALVAAGGAFIALRPGKQAVIPDKRPATVVAAAATPSTPAAAPAPAVTSPPPTPSTATAAAAPSPPKPAALMLRSTPTEMGPPQIEAMLVQHDFYDAIRNAAGKGPTHQYEAKAFGDAVVVIDHATGLMWQKGGSEDGMTRDDAERHVGQLNARKFAGFSDWRLPTLEEAMSLMEPKAVNEYHIAPVFGRGVNFIWTADPAAVKQFGWVLYFHDGEVSREGHNFNAWVRVVRSNAQ